jgi:hypothetical protein
MAELLSEASVGFGLALGNCRLRFRNPMTELLSEESLGYSCSALSNRLRSRNPMTELLSESSCRADDMTKVKIFRTFRNWWREALV